ncbi:MAG: response regulator [SAR324 cluster bacterium]|nr:response regulator [SAR324 cluster bacterium]
MSLPRILIVDDEPTNLKILGEILKGEYTLSFAKSGEEALQRLNELKPDLVLLDIMMPEMDGYQVLDTIQQQPDIKGTPVIFVTAMNEDEDEIKGLGHGAVDYISKPLNPAIVQVRVKTQIKLARIQNQLEEQNKILDQKVDARTKALHNTQREIVLRLVKAAEYRDPETGNHINRMSEAVDILSRHYGLREKECELLKIASLMHDVGKVGTPDGVLLKNGKLTKEEMEVMKLHTMIGDEILEGSRYDLIQIARSIAGSHHERWDGDGYPQGLAGTKIPLEARIAAVADVFDALLSVRPYKKAWSMEEASSYIIEKSGSQFDPQIVEAFERALPELVALRDKYPDEPLPEE